MSKRRRRKKPKLIALGPPSDFESMAAWAIAIDQYNQAHGTEYEWADDVTEQVYDEVYESALSECQRRGLV